MNFKEKCLFSSNFGEFSAKNLQTSQNLQNLQKFAKCQTFKLENLVDFEKC